MCAQDEKDCQPHIQHHPMEGGHHRKCSTWRHSMMDKLMWRITMTIVMFVQSILLHGVTDVI